MKMPRRCPWCDEEFLALETKDLQSTCHAIVAYECGTYISVYSALVQITTPCKKDLPQWMPREAFQEILNGR